MFFTAILVVFVVLSILLLNFTLPTRPHVLSSGLGYVRITWLLCFFYAFYAFKIGIANAVQLMSSICNCLLVMGNHLACELSERS